MYEHGGADVGFSGSGVDGKVKAASPLFQTTEPEPDAAMAHQLVLGGAGAFPADKQLTRLRANVRSGAGPVRQRLRQVGQLHRAGMSWRITTSTWSWT